MAEHSFFARWDSFLYDYHLYYRNLSLKGRNRFVKRVQSVFENTKILGKEGLKVTDEIRIIVISNLVQLTFGLKHFWLYGYEYIYLYPEAFSLRSGTQVSGSTYNDKIISLSWKDFALDHLRAKDGKNLSYSQYALALVRTVFNGKKFDISFGSYLDTWFEIIKKESALKKEKEDLVNLANSQDDIAYVFSKSVELFFEKPALFKKDFPTAYAHLCLLLNQDPLNISEDYVYDRSRLNKNNLKEELPLYISKNYKYKTWHWSYNFGFFGFTACPMVLYFTLDSVLITVFQIISVVVMLGIVGTIVFYLPLKRIGLFFNPFILLLNNLIGVGPCLITAYIVINNIYCYDFTTKISRHKIASYYQVENRQSPSGKSTTFNYSDDFLIENVKARTFDTFGQRTLPIATLFNGVEYEIKNGLLGLPILINRKLY